MTTSPASPNSGSFSPGSLLDSAEFLKRWRGQRSLRAGRLLAALGLIYFLLGATVDYFYADRILVFFDALSIVACLTSLHLTRRRAADGRFVWWPVFTGTWLNCSVTTYLTGGLVSPFLGVYLVLYYVAGMVIQDRVREGRFAAFIIGNLAFWAILHQFAAPALVPQDTLFVAGVTTLVVAATITCVYALLRTEVRLAAEVAKSSAELSDLRVRVSQLAEANAAKAAFLANVSHEIRTPLTAILGFAELIARDPHVAEGAEYGAIIRRNGLYLASLVNDLLDLATVESGRLGLSPEVADLNTILSGVTEGVRPLADKKNLSLALRLAPDVPPNIQTDPTRLRQILSAVLQNAIKFTSIGEITIVTSTPAGSGEFVFVDISDTGVGVSATEAEKLFHVFTQGDESLTRRYGGVGVGLALARHLARALGGDLALAETTPGQGSTFRITIARMMPRAATRQPSTDANRLNDLSTLIVTDDAGLRDRLSGHLAADGAKVATTSNGAGAIEGGLTGDHDVILIDVRLSDMSGYDAALTLRQRGYVRHVIALLPAVGRDERARSLAAGCDDAIPKSVTREALVARLSQLTGSWS